jgi:hypothetical protein
MRSFLLVVCTLCYGLLQAQFGPENLVFESDVKYPNRLHLYDMDGDGDLDAITYTNNYSENTGLQWWENDGAGGTWTKHFITSQNINLFTGRPFADLTGDGHPDMLLTNGWWVNDGNNNFSDATDLGYSPTIALCADLDGDGDLDLYGRWGTLVPPNIIVFQEGIMLNDGEGNFSAGTQTPYQYQSSYSIHGQHSDLNGDGLPDLVISGVNNLFGWYANLGNGQYGPQQSIPAFTPNVTLAAVDVDGDGTTDLLASGAAGTWAANDGLGNFTVMDTMPVNGIHADLDSDGDLDLALNTNTSCDVKWLRNDGAGIAWSTVDVEIFNAYNLSGTRQAFGDVDGDGTTDMVFTHGQGIIGWYPNPLGDGNFGPRERIGQCLGGGNGMQVFDVDLDGDLDVVSSAYYGDWLTWYANDGAGTFGSQQLIAEHLENVDLIGSADLDGDGFGDLITTKPEAAVVRNNNGGSSWSAMALPGNGVAATIADLDGDGDADLIGTGTWYTNDGNGGFTAVPSTELDITGRMSTADMNGDGIVDIVIGNTTTLNVLLNDGAGNFTTITSAVGAVSFSLADLDGDGDIDVAAIPTNWYENDGQGNFATHTWITTPPVGGSAILARDVDNDGVADILWSRSQGYTHESFFVLNDGAGNFGGNNLMDPTAEVTAEFTLADVNGDVVEDLIAMRHHSITWRENHFFNAYRLRGEVFKDYNANGLLDNFDETLPYLLMRTEPQAMLVWTNSLGSYDLPVDSGTTYTLWPQLPSDFQVTSDPTEYMVQADTDQPIVSDLDFGVGPVLDENADMLTITRSPVRCNNEGNIWAVVRNTGSWISEGIQVRMTLHPDMSLISAIPPPDSIVGNTIHWHLDSLPWFALHNFVALVQFGPVGSQADATVEVEFTDNPHILTQSMFTEVGCAYDPNDKQVLPKGYGDQGAIPIDTEWLDYTIRFQNTGNDTAFSVVLVDHLSPYLDWATMEVLGTSHDLSHIGIDEGGKLQFRYEPIQLPDSGANMAASNGFVRFRMRPVAGITSGTVIQNTAEIYFDLNAPVITNTVINTFIDCGLYEATLTALSPDLLQAAEGDSLQWFLNGEPIDGATSRLLLIDLPGSYTVEITNSDGCTDLSDPYQLLPTAVDEQPGIGLALYPNPANTTVRLIATGPITARDRVDVLDAHGRLCKRIQGNGTRELQLDVQELPAGIYVVRITDGQLTKGAVRLVRLD